VNIVGAVGMKASLHGPNRRRNRPGDLSVASDLTGGGGPPAPASASASAASSSIFLIRPVERLPSQHLCPPGACAFTARGEGGRALLRRHAELAGTAGADEPILVHFHDVPVLVMRAVLLPPEAEDGGAGGDGADAADAIYLSRVQCHSHKVCTDSTMEIRCVSGMGQYPPLSAVGVEVFRRRLLRGGQDEAGDGDKDKDMDMDIDAEIVMGRACGDGEGGPGPAQELTVSAKDICRRLVAQTADSVLTNNEAVVVSVEGNELVCRVVEVRLDAAADGGPAGGGIADVTMDDPYRGRVTVGTEYYVSASDPRDLRIEGGRELPRGVLPDDVVHVTTSDGEWFPVRRALLAPCIALTRYVQAGRGKYGNEVPTLPDEQRSEDAPTDDGCPHCRVPMDCCTFDRVLVFITSMLFPEQRSFALDLSEVNALADAADALGLQPLSDICASQVSSFDSRVRQDRHIRFAEVKRRNNENDELLIILDGMVLDITRWLGEHPGGPSIIPTQALNIDCTIFFEMYHVSRQSFLYLKSFYIGELAPEDLANLPSSGEGVKASEGFLQSLRSYTKDWRVDISPQMQVERVHKSL